MIVGEHRKTHKDFSAVNLASVVGSHLRGRGSWAGTCCLSQFLLRSYLSSNFDLWSSLAAFFLITAFTSRFLLAVSKRALLMTGDSNSGPSHPKFYI